MPACNKIAAGYDICQNPAIAEGIEDVIYLFNKGDFAFTLDPNNPGVITGISSVNGAQMYKFTGSSNSFNTVVKDVRTNVGARFEEEIDFNIPGLSSQIKNTLAQMGNGKVQAIVLNNYRNGDSIFECFGFVTGLMSNGSQRNANDETYGGGYQVKLTNPPKQREPMWPRGVNIPPATFGSGTYYYKITALTAAGETVGSTEVSVSTTSQTTGIQLTWTAIAGATSYRIYRGTSAGAENVYYTTSATSYLDLDLPASAGTIPGVNTAAISAPTLPSLAGSATGGTLTAGTYYYKVTAVNAQGETVGSSEASVVTSGTTSSVTISWPAVTGAASYKVYRGTTAGGESVYFTSAGTSFTDTGATGTAGSIPVSNTAVLAAPAAPSITGSTAGTSTASYATTLAALEALVAH